MFSVCWIVFFYKLFDVFDLFMEVKFEWMFCLVRFDLKWFYVVYYVVELLNDFMDVYDV